MKIKALNLSRKNIGFFLTALSPDILFNLSRVERVSENPEEGFQRQLDETRAKKISKYLAEKIIPGAIILSARDGCHIKYIEESGELEISEEMERMLVIDGQHRLYGAKKAFDSGVHDIKLAVCILTNLNLTEEINYFIDINSTQKGVPKTLRIELTKFLVEQESVDEIRLRLFRDLNLDPESCLCGKLSAEQKGPGYLSHVPFEVAINKYLNSDRVIILDYEKKKSLLKNYINGIYFNLMDADASHKMTQSAFFQAAFRVFEKACDITLSNHKNYKQESFEKTFNVIEKINFELHSGSNEEAILKLEKDLIDKLDIERQFNQPADLF